MTVVCTFDMSGWGDCVCSPTDLFVGLRGTRVREEESGFDDGGGFSGLVCKFIDGASASTGGQRRRDVIFVAGYCVQNLVSVNSHRSNYLSLSIKLQHTQHRPWSFKHVQRVFHYTLHYESESQ